MAPNLDNLLPAITGANHIGLTFAKIKAKFIGKRGAKAKDVEAELREKLAGLVREGAIWGPLKHRAGQYYFAAGRGPSIETTSTAVVRLVFQSGAKLLSKPALEKKVTGMNRLFFADAIKHAVASRAIAELACGASKYYLHRNVAADLFGFEESTDGDAIPLPQAKPSTVPPLSLADLLPVYRRLRAEQGGFSAVKIFDLMKALNVPKEVLHHLLVEETKAGRITIHHTTSVRLPQEVIDASIRLPGYAEPFVTIVVKNDQ